MNICELCIKEKVVFQRLRGEKTYCVLEQNIEGLNGKYRRLAPMDEDEYNFECNYKYIIGIRGEKKNNEYRPKS